MKKSILIALGLVLATPVFADVNALGFLFGGNESTETSSLHINDDAISNEPTAMDISAAEDGIKILLKPSYGSYFDWGRGRNGWGYCYEWASNGTPLHGGQPVSNWYCENVRPSYYYWGQGRNGWGYCYQYTPYGVAMNEGQPVSNWNCENVAPSHYNWGRGRDGNTYCYQWTPNGYPMNEGQPVSHWYCRP